MSHERRAIPKGMHEHIEAYDWTYTTNYAATLSGFNVSNVHALAQERIDS
jgi:hypothetical protein